MWHELFFPDMYNVNLVEGNILNNINDTATIYFNFCGTVNEDYRYNIYKNIEHITKLRDNNLSIMVSFSIRGQNRTMDNEDNLTNYGLYEALVNGINVITSFNDDGCVNSEYLQKLKAVSVCLRRSFITLAVLADD